jgi:hypothetical protein
MLYILYKGIVSNLHIQVNNSTFNNNFSLISGLKNFINTICLMMWFTIFIKQQFKVPEMLNARVCQGFKWH